MLFCTLDFDTPFIYTIAYISDCPANQTSGCGMVPPPSCANPHLTQTDGVGCFCPDGMLIKANDLCVLPNTCIGEVKHIYIIIACIRSTCTALVQHILQHRHYYQG